MRSTILLAAVFLALCCSFSTSESPKFLGKSTCVTIKNAAFKEYLYPQTIMRGVGPRLAIYTWRRTADGPPSNWKKRNDQTNQGVWLLEREDTKNCENCFKILSVYVKDDIQTLFSISTDDPRYKTSRPRRPNFVYRGKYFPRNEGQNIWFIDMVTGSTHVQIQSKIGKNVGEVLYAVGDDEATEVDRRPVFSWSSKEDSEAFTEQGEWILEKVKCPPYIKN